MEMLTDQLPAFSFEQLDMPDICSLISFTLPGTMLRLAVGVTVALL